MFHDEGMAGLVRRNSGGKEFYLVLAEIEALEEFEELSATQQRCGIVLFVDSRQLHAVLAIYSPYTAIRSSPVFVDFVSCHSVR